MAAALCHGYCYGSPQPVTIVSSRDGGVTWGDVAALERGGWGTLLAIDREALLVQGLDETDPWAIVPFPPGDTQKAVTFPAGVRPEQGVFAAHDDAGATLLAALGSDKRTLWNVAGSGSKLTTIPLSAELNPMLVAGLVRRPGGLEVQVLWFKEANGPKREGYLGFVDVDSSTLRAVYGWSTQDGLGRLQVKQWLSPTLAIGRADFEPSSYGLQGLMFSGVPALIDFEAATVAPLENFVEQLAWRAGGPVPQSLLIGPFARVVSGEDCLNVRVGPSVDAQVLGCYRDGVLLPLRGQSQQTVAGVEWRAVTTPDERAGWASAEFLEVVPTE